MENSYSKSNCDKMSDDIRQLAQAFLLAKRAFDKTGRSSKSNHGKYATLSDIYGAVEDALMDNSIIICHYADYLAEGIEILHTRLIHAPSGQFIQDTRVLYSEKPGNQAKGSANTYMKKYAVLSLCSIAAEDDDGQEEQRHIEAHGSRLRPSFNSSLITVEQQEELGSLIKKQKDPAGLWKTIKEYNKVEDLSELTEAQYNNIRTNVLKR